MSTTQTDEEPLAKLREEYLKQLVERYEAQSKRFRTLLFGFLTFGTVFHLLVLIPFVGLHVQRQAVNAELDAVRRQVGSLAVALTAYEQSTNGFAALRSAIDSGAYELRNALRELAAPAQTPPLDAPSQQMVQQSGIEQSPIRQSPEQRQARSRTACDSQADSTAYIDCRVAELVRNQFAHYAHLLTTYVLQPIDLVPVEIATRPDSARLHRGLDSLQGAFERRLAETPRFWENFGGKVDFFDKLKRDLEVYWTKYGFEEQKEILQASHASLNSAIDSLEEQGQRIESLEKRLDARLAQIESPLGRLPIGLIEGVQIFPLLMAIGFLWCCAVLTELVSMRSEVKDGYRHRGPEEAALIDRHLSLVAPLWIARRGSSTLDVTARLVLFTPIAIFAIGCTLVIYYWWGWSDADDLSALDHWMYGALYLLAAAALFVASRRTIKLIRQVRRESAPAA